MGFKLVRLDATEPYKVALPLGLHVIGRGCEKLFLNCNDNRVGRVHADIRVTEDTVLLKSHHRNPCYVKTKSSAETRIFSYPDSQLLCNGDKFGLLPDNFWYEVIETEESSAEPTESIANVHNNENLGNQDNANGDKDENTQSYKNEENEDMLNNESLQSDVPPIQQKNQASTATELETKSENSPKNSSDNINKTVPPTESGRVETPNKRVHSEEDPPCDVKRVKTEPEESPNKDSKDEAQPSTPQATASTPVKTDPGSPEDAKPGPSNDQGGPSNDSTDNPSDRAPSPVKPQFLPLRERCMYGINCYRRNPQHKEQYSHPADLDWGAGSRGVCPRGAHCHKADPRHWAGHQHPPGVQPPPPRAPGNRPGMQLVRRHGNNYYINANAVHFYDDHFEVEDSDGDSVDFDYEF